MDTIVITSAVEVPAGVAYEFRYTDAFFLDGRGGAQTSLVLKGSAYAYLDEASPLHGGSLFGIAHHYEGNYEGSFVRIEAGGVLKVSHTAGTGAAYGFMSYSSQSADLSNAGLIDVVASHAAYGVVTSHVSASRFDFVNTGTIRVQGHELAIAVKCNNGSNFFNSGTIVSDGADQPFIIAAHLTGFRTNFVNEGYIGSNKQHGTAVHWDSTFGVGDVFRNEGTLEGEYALQIGYWGIAGDTIVTPFVNNGLMLGKISVFDAGVTLVNNGFISGEVTFNILADRFDGAAGVQRALVHGGGGDDTLTGGREADTLRGGDGNDSLVGGDAFDDMHGNLGQDTLYGGLGGDWVVGGQGNDMLFGEQDADVVYGNLGNDTVEGGHGNDWVRGGQGDDQIWAGDGDDYIAGDRGADTISGGGGADLFHAFSGGGIDRIVDFKAAEGDRVNVLAGTTYTLRQEGADTIVDMGNGDQVVLVGVTLSTLPAGWIFTG